jgi:hypothetical protein
MVTSLVAPDTLSTSLPSSQPVGPTTPVGAIIGGAVGGAAAVLALLALFWCRRRRHRRPGLLHRRRRAEAPVIPEIDGNAEFYPPFGTCASWFAEDFALSDGRVYSIRTRARNRGPAIARIGRAPCVCGCGRRAGSVVCSYGRSAIPRGRRRAKRGRGPALCAVTPVQPAWQAS